MGYLTPIQDRIHPLAYNPSILPATYDRIQGCSPRTDKHHSDVSLFVVLTLVIYVNAQGPSLMLLTARTLVFLINRYKDTKARRQQIVTAKGNTQLGQSERALKETWPILACST